MQAYTLSVKCKPLNQFLLLSSFSPKDLSGDEIYTFCVVVFYVHSVLTLSVFSNSDLPVTVT